MRLPHLGRSARLRAARALAVTLLTIWAAALRADALVGRYGPLPPGLTGDIVQGLAGAGACLRPRSVGWHREPTPYVGGDPINYLAYARQMQSFYQPHVREPVFLSLVRSQLWLVDNRDIAVSMASAISSILVVPAAYLAGAAAFGPLVGVGAAAAWAIELESVRWSVEGWRDDTFTLFITLLAWALLRVSQNPSAGPAIGAGVIAGFACLTRLSALISVASGIVWTILEAPRGARRPATRAAALSTLTAGLIVGPYLMSCAIATGDPFYAVNYHTKYYRFAEGLSPTVDESALHFMGRQFHQQPLHAMDTAAGGMFSWPFDEKWGGFERWSPVLARVLKWSSAFGLVLCLGSTSGRILLVLLFSSLAPYCLTWVLGGGGAWRFSEHVYPIYLIAAFQFLHRLASVAAEFVRRPSLDTVRLTTRAFRRGTALLGAAAVIWLVYVTLPLFVEREALERGEPAMVDARARHRWFLIGDWSAAHTAGNVTFRAARALHVGLRLLLPRKMDYLLTLRLDPISTRDWPDADEVALFFNGRPLQTLRLTYDPARVGMYRLRVPEQMTQVGFNRIDLLASRTVAAGSAGPEFAWLDQLEPVAFRLWYFRLEPLSEPVPQEP